MSFDFYTSAFHPKALNNVCLMWQVFWLSLLLNTFPFRLERNSGMQIQLVSGER